MTFKVLLAPVPPKTKLESGNKVSSLDDSTDKTITFAAVSTSPMTRSRVFDASSLIEKSGISKIVGRSLTAVTVKEKESVAIKPEGSLTEIVMVAVPEEFAMGVTVTVRSTPSPPMTTLARGIIEVLSTETEIVRASPSTSVRVKLSGPATSSSNMVRSTISLIRGASLIGFTVKVNVSCEIAVGSPL